MGPHWQNETLVLQLEHKNGISNDNRIENLCILCPNCHSQTPTYAGKRFNKHKVKKARDRSYKPRPHCRKVVRPDKHELEKLLWGKPASKIAADYGVKGRAISQWAKYYNIKKPPIGYWRKKRPECVPVDHWNVIE